MEATRYIDLINRVAAAQQAGDDESAYRHARDLRTSLDVLCRDLLQKYMALPADDAELSAVVHDDEGFGGNSKVQISTKTTQFLTRRVKNLSPLDQARVDLARCVAARDAKRGAR